MQYVRYKKTLMVLVRVVVALFFGFYLQRLAVLFACCQQRIRRGQKREKSKKTARDPGRAVYIRVKVAH